MRKKRIYSKVREIAEDFWAPILPYRIFPVDIERVIAFSNLPLHINIIPGLDIEYIRNWIKEKQFPARLNKENCALHGFLLACEGHGVIFVNGTDHSDERRFTIAHELAHFLMDYYLPRINYINLYGNSILEILDGKRPATLQERLTFLVSHHPFPSFIHLLDHSGITAYERAKLWNIEWQTDTLAFEILAPFHVVVAYLKELNLGKRFDLIFHQASDLLVSNFGIPSTLSFSYAKYIAGSLSRRITLAEEWGIRI